MHLKIYLLLSYFNYHSGVYHFWDIYFFAILFLSIVPWVYHLYVSVIYILLYVHKFLVLGI